MKKWLLLLLACCAFVGTLTAQEQFYILSGRITDAKNKPVDKATIQAVGSARMVFAVSDSDGLYSTGPTVIGKHEIIIKAGKATWLAQLEIKKGDPVARFYNIKLVGPQQAKLIVTTDDPYKAVAYEHLKKKPSIDIPEDATHLPYSKEEDQPTTDKHPAPKKKK